MSSWSTSDGQLKTASAAGVQPTNSVSAFLLAPLESFGVGGGGWTLAERRAIKATEGGAWAAADLKPLESGDRIHKLVGGLLLTALPTTGLEDKHQEKEKQLVAGATERANLSWYRRVAHGDSKRTIAVISATSPAKLTATLTDKGCPAEKKQPAKRLNGKKQRKRRSSIIAHASSNLVDKLTYMIKNSSARNESDFVVCAGEGEQRQQRQTGATKAAVAAATAAAAVAVAATAAEEKAVAATTATASRLAAAPQARAAPSQKAGGSGNRYLLGELSRRLVKRCTKSRAVQFATRVSGATGSLNKSKSASNTMEMATATAPMTTPAPASSPSNNERSSRAVAAVAAAAAATTTIISAEQQQPAGKSSQPQHRALGGGDMKQQLATSSTSVKSETIRSSKGGSSSLYHIARGPFDDHDHNKSSESVSNNNQSVTAPIMSDAKQHLPLPPTPASASSSRKSSTKEKKRRQKEAEKVEKLRLLVSYLKSGTSQQLLNPLELEADEIELAQKYKSSQLVLCEECLQASEQQQQQQQAVATKLVDSASWCGLSTGATSSVSIPASASNGRLATLSGSRSPDASSSIQLNRHNFEPESPALMFHQYNLYHHHCPHQNHHHSSEPQHRQRQEHCGRIGIGGELSPPALLMNSSCRSMPGDSVGNSNNNNSSSSNNNNIINNNNNNNKASSCRDCKQGGDSNSDGGADGHSCSQRTRNAQSSNPHHIGNLPWGMRHSISDPGSNFERTQKGVCGAQGQLMLGSAASGSGASSSHADGRGYGDGSASVAGGASYSYESCSSSAQISRQLQGFGQSGQRQSAASSSIQSPKSMFYIDEMERKDSDSSDTNSQLLVNTHHSHNSNCNYQHHDHYMCDEHSRQKGSKATISSSEAIRDLPTRSWSSELFLTSTPNSAANTNTISGNATGAPTNTKNNLPTVTLTSMTSTFDSSSSSSSNNNNNNNGNTSTQTNASSNNTVSPAASSGKTSAWTNPQTLATWIDNEVKSLVNDLEAKSQLVKSEKHVKSSKRKWLSSSSRRNSSGAHST